MIHYLSAACKLVDAFSGAPIQGAIILAEPSQKRFLEKGNGLYAISNLESGTYFFTITAQGYAIQKRRFIVGETEKEFTCFLYPNQSEQSILLSGSMTQGGQPLTHTVFYFAIDQVRYRGILQGETQKGEKQVRFHIYRNESLEGRRLAIARDTATYTLGKFDYLQKQYRMIEQAEKTFTKGSEVYLLFEAQTDSAGKFTLCLPRYLWETDTLQIIFFLQKKIQKNSINCINQTNFHVQW